MPTTTTRRKPAATGVRRLPPPPVDEDLDEDLDEYEDEEEAEEPAERLTELEVVRVPLDDMPWTGPSGKTYYLQDECWVDLLDTMSMDLQMQIAELAALGERLQQADNNLSPAKQIAVVRETRAAMSDAMKLMADFVVTWSMRDARRRPIEPPDEDATDEDRRAILVAALNGMPQDALQFFFGALTGAFREDPAGKGKGSPRSNSRSKARSRPRPR